MLASGKDMPLKKPATYMGKEQELLEQLGTAALICLARKPWQIPPHCSACSVHLPSYSVPKE